MQNVIKIVLITLTLISASSTIIVFAEENKGFPVEQFPYSELSIQVMPEFTTPKGWPNGQPAVLIGYHGRLINQTGQSYSGVIELPIPTKENNFTIGYLAQYSEQGEELIELEAEINLETSIIRWQPNKPIGKDQSYYFVIEYYFIPQKNEGITSFSYSLIPETKIEKANILIYQPYGASEFKIKPYTDYRSANDYGVPIYIYQYENLVQDQQKEFRISYVKKGTATTLDYIHQMQYLANTYTGNQNVKSLNDTTSLFSKSGSGTALIGNLTIYLGLVISIYSLIIFIVGIKRQDQRLINSGKGGVLAVFILATIAILLLLYLLGTSQFQFKYVATYTSSDLPLIYKLVALWAGNAGSLLLWTFLLTMYTAIITFSKKMKNSPMVPYIATILLANIIFFYFILSRVTNPFELLPSAPSDGNGLNPMLQDVGMILHPVTLYLGYVGLAVPYAFAIAALILKNTDALWIKMTRRWTILAWLFLTLGNLIGGYWSYMELGWGGYWAWDPVENASLMPWLTVTAFLHSVMIQERKNMLKVWNISLIIISYALTLFGTFLVRSGILTSVHAFVDSNLGTYFLIYLAIVVLFSLYVLLSRYHLLTKDSGQIKSYFSKESSFLINNLILVGATFAIFWGTIFPLISEAVRGTKVSVGAPFFNTIMAPFMLSLLFVMAICVLIAWQQSTFRSISKNFTKPAILSLIITVILAIAGIREIYPLLSFMIVSFLIFTHLMEFYRGTKARKKATGERSLIALMRLISRNRRRYGGYIVHLGIALIAIGVIGSNSYEIEVMKTLDIGEKVTIKEYTFTYNGLEQKSQGYNEVVYADLRVEKNGRLLKSAQPEKIFYANSNQPSTEVALNSGWKEDIYLVLNSWDADNKATFIFKINPLVKWIWVGGYLIVFGTIIALWNGKRENITPKYIK